MKNCLVKQESAVELICESSDNYSQKGAISSLEIGYIIIDRT